MEAVAGLELVKVVLSEFGKSDAMFSSAEKAHQERRKRCASSLVGPWSAPVKSHGYGGKEVWWSVAKWYGPGGRSWKGSIVREWRA